MIEPDDFGLSPVQTLAHVGDPVRASSHSAFWKIWNTAVFATQPRLLERGHAGRPAAEEDPSDPTATHQFESCRHVRIGCRLLWPESGRPRGGVIILHGYENIPHLEQTASDWQPLCDSGVAVLILRIRGYRGSQLDARQLAALSNPEGGGQWITYGLGEPIGEHGMGCEWAFSAAIADVVNGYRALRRELARTRGGDALPISIYGESFGGALAILAASALLERDEPARLAIGLPSMGDWPWRLTLPEHAARGAGGIIRRYLASNPQREQEILELLRVHDTVIHARRIRCPVVCKLALRDDVAPAPSAAAVFNALATPPGLKRRFVTRYGHFDGGITDLRRHAVFDSLVRQFLDPANDPQDVLYATEVVHAR